MQGFIKSAERRTEGEPRDIGTVVPFGGPGLTPEDVGKFKRIEEIKKKLQEFDAYTEAQRRKCFPGCDTELVPVPPPVKPIEVGLYGQLIERTRTYRRRNNFSKDDEPQQKRETVFTTRRDITFSKTDKETGERKQIQLAVPGGYRRAATIRKTVRNNTQEQVVGPEREVIGIVEAAAMLQVPPIQLYHNAHKIPHACFGKLYLFSRYAIIGKPWPEEEDKQLTLNDCGELLGLNPFTVRKWTSRGMVRSHQEEEWPHRTLVSRNYLLNKIRGVEEKNDGNVSGIV